MPLHSTVEASAVPYNLHIVELDDRIRGALDRALAEVREAARLEADEVRRAAELSAAALRDSTRRFSDCMKAIDAAPSLGAVLILVAEFARRETGQSSVMIARDGDVLSYPSRIVVPAEHGSVVRTALDKRQPVIEGAAAVFPIVLGGRVAAVLSTGAPSSPEALTALDLVARHAGRVLEAMTVCQIAGLAPLSSRRHLTSAGNVS